jgi:hypothetical protein
MQQIEEDEGVREQVRNSEIKRQQEIEQQIY